MKKDYFIEKNLDKMVDEIRPPDQVLSGARRAILDNNAKRAQPKRLRAIAALAAIVIIAVVSIFIYNSAIKANPPKDSADNNIAPDTTPYSYGLSGLSGRLALESDLAEINIFDLGDNTAQFHRIYQNKTTGEIEVTISKVKSVTAHGTDEVIIVADIGGGLKDYQSFKTGSLVFSQGEDEIVYVEKYENGEWYTYAYFQKDDIDYYLTIMSPAKNTGEYYFQLFL